MAAGPPVKRRVAPRRRQSTAAPRLGFARRAPGRPSGAPVERRAAPRGRRLNAEPSLGAGLLVTGELLGLTTALGFALALLLALARRSGLGLLAWPAGAFVAIIRGTPLLVQIFLVYYGLPQFGLVRHSALWPLLRHAWPCAVLALSLNMGAYSSEVIRAALDAVPRGEREAAASLGLRRRQILSAVVLPRALRLGLPALANEVLVQLKATALVSTITLVDLTGAARRQSAASFTATPLLEAGLLYAALAAILGLAFAGTERALKTGR